MKCAIYMRVSSERQREKYSLSSQKRILTEHAKRQGWDYVFYDEGVGSGETIVGRPQMYQLLEDAKKRKFNVCLVIEMERLSRGEDLFDWLTIKKVFRDNDIKIATPNQIFDLADDEDDFISDLFGALAKREKKKLLKRTKRGLLEAVRKGQYVGSHYRLGYKYNKATRKLEVVSEEAEVVKLIFKLCNEDDMGIDAIAEHLRIKGIPTVLGFAKRKGVYDPKKEYKRLKEGEWSGRTVWRILTNPIYHGVYYYNRVEHKNKRVVGKRPRKDWVEMAVDPIITKEEFDLAQERLKARSKWADRNTKTEYLLGGLLYCGHCGSRLQGATFKACEKRDKSGNLARNKKGHLLKRWKTTSYYKCYGRSKKAGHKCKLPYVRTEKIDKLIWKEIRSRVKQPRKLIDAEIERKRCELEKQSVSLPNRLEKLERELKKIQQAEDRVLDAYSMDGLHMDEMSRQMVRLRARKELAETEINELKLHVGDNQGREETLKGISEYLRYVKGAIDYFKFEDRRDFLRRCIYKITIDLDGGITIDGAFDLSTTEEQHELVSPNSGT